MFFPLSQEKPPNKEGKTMLELLEKAFLMGLGGGVNVIVAFYITRIIYRLIFLEYT